MSSLFDKPDMALLGDKSPDFCQSPQIVEHFASAAYPLIYTVRDPRAILRSIDMQSDATDLDKAIRWETLIANYRVWKPHLDAPNVLVVRFEDLVASPQVTMTAVYSHLGLPDSTRFLEPFARQFPRRFLWPTAIDLEPGIKKDFDSHRIWDWSQHLSGDQLQQVYSKPLVTEFMERFGYER